MSPNPIIWEPDAARIRASAMYQFMRQQGFDDYQELHQWSIDEAASFWSAICRFCEIEFDQTPQTILARPDNIMDAGWFQGGGHGPVLGIGVDKNPDFLTNLNVFRNVFIG